jgi:hypothetical protein
VLVPQAAAVARRRAGAPQLGVDLAASWHVGTGPADRGFAERLGLRYLDAASWWRDPPPPPP